MTEFVHCLCCDEVFVETFGTEECPYCGCGSDDTGYLDPDAEDFEDLIEGVIIDE